MALYRDRHLPISRRERAIFFARAAPVRIAVIAVAALTLASCATSSVTSAPSLVQGVPTFGVSVALQQVSCTLGDSCVALGASSASVGPSAVGEYRQSNGRWTSIAVPPVSSAQIISSSCWSSDCLIGGAQSTGDLLWDYSASSHSLVNVNPPSGGVGVSAIHCFATLSCVVIDNHFNGQPRLFETVNGGSTWTTPISIPWAAGGTISALACTSALSCLASSSSTAGLVGLYVTFDGGTSWVQRPTPATWTSMAGLHCWIRTCVTLVTTSSGSFVERSTSFARHWSNTALAVSATALSCTNASHCVAVGQDSSTRPWLGQIVRRTVTPRTLRYVPTSLLDVSCGQEICAAVAATTLLSLKP